MPARLTNPENFATPMQPINPEARANVRFGAHSGFKSDIAQGLKVPIGDIRWIVADFANPHGFAQRIEIRRGWWRCRPPRRGARRDGNAGSSSARTDASRP